MNNLPDELKIGKLNYVQAMDIISNKLEPVQKSTTFTRWKIPNVGILDSSSRIQFSVHNIAGAGDDLGFLPVSARNCIKSAVLKIGGRVLARTDDHGYWAMCDQMFTPQEIRERIDLPAMGSVDASWEPSENGDGKYQLKSCVFDSGVNFLPSAKYCRLTSSKTNTPVYSVALSDLFLFCKNRQIPLFALGQSECVLEVTWQTQTTSQEGQLCMFESSYAGDKSAEVATDNQLFLSDHLMYSDGVMSNILEKINKDGLVISYEDILLIKSQTTAPTTPGGGVVTNQTVTNQLGLSGKNIRSIFVHDSDGTTSEMKGIYKGYCPNVPSESNWNINDRQLYQRNIVSETRKLTELAKTRGAIPHVLPSLYSKDPLTNKSDITRAKVQSLVTTDTFSGYTQANIEGEMHIEGVDLSISDINAPGQGILVGQKNIEHKRILYRTAADNPSLTTRYFVVYERLLKLQGGVISVV